MNLAVKLQIFESDNKIMNYLSHIDMFFSVISDFIKEAINLGKQIHIYVNPCSELVVKNVLPYYASHLQQLDKKYTNKNVKILDERKYYYRADKEFKDVACKISIHMPKNSGDPNKSDKSKIFIVHIYKQNNLAFLCHIQNFFYMLKVGNNCCGQLAYAISDARLLDTDPKINTGILRSGNLSEMFRQLDNCVKI